MYLALLLEKLVRLFLFLAELLLQDQKSLRHFRLEVDALLFEKFDLRKVPVDDFPVARRIHGGTFLPSLPRFNGKGYLSTTLVYFTIYGMSC